ncbi:hypothetical protein PC128_g5000 [Phytophthora cactorum]|nr:hypothetical protein PC128_g5000 [Phytophthora cactorum]
MKQARVYCDDRGALPHVVTSQTRIFTAQRKLLLVWLLAGVAPFVLQMRSFLKFVTPHKLTKSLIVPSGSPEETRNLVEICPVRALILSGVWWNVEPTHYYLVGSKRICHFVAPQYNTHGNYLIGATKVEPYDTTPTNCADDSYAFDQYFYHGSIGYYSFYEEQTGTYCAKDNTVYIFGNGLGSFDINGSSSRKTQAVAAIDTRFTTVLLALFGSRIEHLYYDGVLFLVSAMADDAMKWEKTSIEKKQ